MSGLARFARARIGFHFRLKYFLPGKEYLYNGWDATRRAKQCSSINGLSNGRNMSRGAMVRMKANVPSRALERGCTPACYWDPAEWASQMKDHNIRASSGIQRAWRLR